MKGNSENPNLDFLRACAVLFVVGFHLLLFFQMTIGGPLDFHSLGNWGVLIFFVHTSFVLAFSLERQANRTAGQGLFWPFLIRRIFRILPLSVVIVLAVVYLDLPVEHLKNGVFVPVQFSFVDTLSNLFLVQNLTHSESAEAPLWSLPYEMQMYLLLPTLYLLARSIRGTPLLFLIWGIGVVAAGYHGYFDRHGYPDLLCYAPYFLSGIVAYKFSAAPKIRLPAALWPVALACITALYLERPTEIRGSICCLSLGLAIPHFAQISQSTVVKISREIARYSYGIYLTHFIVIWFAFQELDSLPRMTEWAVFVVLASLIPFALYHAIEAPMIRLGQRMASKLDKNHDFSR